MAKITGCIYPYIRTPCMIVQAKHDDAGVEVLIELNSGAVQHILSALVSRMECRVRDSSGGTVRMRFTINENLGDPTINEKLGDTT